MTTIETPLAGQQTTPTRTPKATSQLAWLVLGIAALCSLALCALAGYGLWRFRAYTVVPQEDNTLEAYKSSVSLMHAGEVLPIAVPLERPVQLLEGETIQVAEDAPAGAVALVTIWDGSTLQLFAGTEVTLQHLRATRYSSRRQEVVLEMPAGQLLLGVARMEHYQQVDFSVRTPDALVRLEPAGSYLLRVGEGTEVAVRRGRAYVLAESDRTLVVLEAGLKTIVRTGQPVAVETARWELLQNGDFTRGARGMEGWTFRSDQAGDGGTVDATYRHEEQTIEGRTVWAVGLERKGGIQDRCQAILAQEVGADLSVYRSVRLDFDLRINYQSFPSGRPPGADYPFAVRIRYQDDDGRSREYVYGFYYRAEEKVDVEVAGQEAIWFPHYRWEHVSLDLGSLRPRPVRLNGIDLFASGGDYLSWVTNISLVASLTAD